MKSSTKITYKIPAKRTLDLSTFHHVRVCVAIARVVVVHLLTLDTGTSRGRFKFERNAFLQALFSFTKKVEMGGAGGSLLLSALRGINLCTKL